MSEKKKPPLMLPGGPFLLSDLLKEAFHKPFLYRLENRIPIVCENVLEWARWRASHEPDIIVLQEDVGPYWVSTVFLGIDHRVLVDGPPLLFETMIFARSGDFDPVDANNELFRHETWWEAEERHRFIVNRLKEKLDAKKLIH